MILGNGRYSKKCVNLLSSLNKRLADRDETKTVLSTKLVLIFLKVLARSAKFEILTIRISSSDF